MNLKEGTRRLALLLGALGIIAGGFASYVELQTVLPQRAAHRHFEQLANSEVVKQERKTLQSPPKDSLAGAKRVKPAQSGPWQKYAANQPQSAPWARPDGTQPAAGPRPGTEHPEVDWDKLQPVKPGSGASPDVDWSTAQPIASDVMKDGIKTINWSHDYGVASIETEDGQTLYPTPAPSAWRYLMIALFPILGFFIPWGAIRAMGWVGAGYVDPAK